jgi:hypothetical protein
LRDLLKQKKKKKSSRRSKGTTRLTGAKIVPDEVHSVGETIVNKRAESSKCEKNSPLSSIMGQTSTKTTNAKQSVLAQRAEWRAEKCYELGENICSGAKNQNLLAIVTEAIFSMDFDSLPMPSPCNQVALWFLPLCLWIRNLISSVEALKHFGHPWSRSPTKRGEARLVALQTKS